MVDASNNNTKRTSAYAIPPSSPCLSLPPPSLSSRDLPPPPSSSYLLLFLLFLPPFSNSPSATSSLPPYSVQAFHLFTLSILIVLVPLKMIMQIKYYARIAFGLGRIISLSYVKCTGEFRVVSPVQTPRVVSYQ